MYKLHLPHFCDFVVQNYMALPVENSVDTVENLDLQGKIGGLILNSLWKTFPDFLSSLFLKFFIFSNLHKSTNLFPSRQDFYPLLVQNILCIANGRSQNHK